MPKCVCPLSCGYCCQTSWHSVKALAKKFMLEAARAQLTNDPCPHQGPEGCELPRDERPETCLTFVCDLSMALTNGDVTLEWAKEQMAKNDNNPLDVWNDYADGIFKTELPEDTLKQLRERREKGSNNAEKDKTTNEGV